MKLPLKRLALRNRTGVLALAVALFVVIIATLYDYVGGDKNEMSLSDIVSNLFIPISVYVAYLTFEFGQINTKKLETINRIISDQSNQYIVSDRAILLHVRDSGFLKFEDFLFADELYKIESDENKIEELFRANDPGISTLAPVGGSEVGQANKALRTYCGRYKEAIVGTLNRHEIMAIAISDGALDEKIYKSYWCSTVLSDYDLLEDAIKAIRVRLKSEGPYSAFQRLAERWRFDQRRTDGEPT